MIAYSVVVPVYRSEQCLPELVQRLTDVFRKTGVGYEIVMVDDDSPDRSWEVLKDLSRRFPHLRAYRLMKNMGQANATLFGLAHAAGEIVITMDDDLQHAPENIPDLISVLTDDPMIDCVFAYFPEKKHAWYRNMGSKVIRRVNSRAFGLKRGQHTSTFRVMRKAVAERVSGMSTANPVILTMILGITSKIASVPLPHHERFAGRSGYTLAKQFRLAFDNICNVSMLPLRIVSVMGVFASLFAMVLTLIFMYNYLTGYTQVAGWTSLVILVSFFSGLILLSIGILGEYMIRVLREVKGQAAPVEREMVESASHESARSSTP